MCVCDALEAVSMQKSHRSVSSAVELRQAIVAMMNRKDELEEQNTYVGIYSSYLLLANFQMLHHTHVLRLEELLLLASRDCDLQRFNRC